MDLQLLLALAFGVGGLIGLILLTRLDAFIALLVAALATGLIAGSPPVETVEAITTGFGNTLASIGIVIILGVVIGKLLEISGAADAIAAAFLRLVGRGREDWAMAGTGALVSIPVFCDSGFVIMHPVPRSLTRVTGRSFVALSLALGAGMTVTHHLVPPTPGPLAVAGILGVDIGRMILYGGAMAILLVPVVVLYARWMGPRLDDTVDDDIKADIAVGVGAHTQSSDAEAAPVGSGGGTDDDPTGGGGVAELHSEPSGSTPGMGRAFMPLVIPIVLIVGNTVSSAVAEESQIAGIFSFIGDPVVALLIGGLIALYTLVPEDSDRSTVGGWLSDAIASAGIILAITGAGGALGNVLRSSGVGDAMADAIAGLALPGFLIPFFIATLVRLAQGSGTVAMITAGSLTAPLLGTAVELDPVLAALAATAGSMFFSYYNDSYFWVVTKFTGLDGTAALKGWSGITTALWAGSLVLLALLSLIL